MMPKKTNEPRFRDALKAAVKLEDKVQNTLVEFTGLLHQIGGFTMNQILEVLNSYDWGKDFANEFKDDIKNDFFTEAFRNKKTKEKQEEEYKRFIIDAPKRQIKYIETPKIKIERKDVLTELIYREISKLDEILQVLEDLKVVVPDEGYELSESDAFCWIENEPSREEKKRVLTALGYDVSKL